MSEFYTTLNRPGRVYAPLGGPEKIKYQLVVDPDGSKHLEECGVVNMYDIIQSHKESTLIENIVRRAVAGDSTALAKTQGVYYDTTLLPQDLIGAHEAVNVAESIFKKLPFDVRQQYSSFKEFVSSFGTMDGLMEFYANLTKQTAPSQQIDVESDVDNDQNGGDDSAS